MRTDQDSKEKTVTFIKDLGKAALCKCPHCLNEVIVFGDTGHCRFCGGELVYPTMDWVNW